MNDAAINAELDKKVLEIDAGQGAATLQAVHDDIARVAALPRTAAA